ncbi:hypothetical protein SDC9_115366 [bioreactor metagenome]|uniref:Uncharacterized protein n=1 Tax=bioreactor metagenome TaxID=1076179 RepID=A0A645C393_9ZZZZ
MFLGFSREPLGDAAGQFKQPNILGLGQTCALVKLRKLDDVLHQRDQVFGFIIYARSKVAHVAGLNKPVFHDLGIAGYRRERRFKLMRNVCRKFSAPELPALFRADIDDEQYNAAHFIFDHNRACRNAVGVPTQLQRFLALHAARRRIRRALERRAAIDVHDVLIAQVEIAYAKESQRAFVDRKHVALCVEYDKPFAHVLGYGSEFVLFLAQFCHLRLDLFVLFGYF